ncbi:hypothetical protein GQ600_638 [Phytophthora cactorum]|nr:hypothetical protein GQ600_638 [Phytophthora cactorum]
MLVKGLRQGQDDGRYLVLGVDLLGQLDGVTCSPFGAVPKGNVDLTVMRGSYTIYPILSRNLSTITPQKSRMCWSLTTVRWH